jgi:hypothetical protein
MGQKANTFSLKKLVYSLEHLNLNTKLFLYSFSFSKVLDKLLFKKHILLVENKPAFQNNQMFLNLIIFFRTAKLLKYKKKSKAKKIRFLKFNLLSSFIKKQFSLFNFNVFVFNIKVLNKFLDKVFIFNFYLKVKTFLKTLFNRRFTLFLDFLKINSLFKDNLISAKIYLFFLALIFKNLQKKRHRTFLDFLELIFQHLIKLNLSSTNCIKGIKFIVSGRLGAKPRSSNAIILVGKVPTQSVSKSIEFSKTHVYTVYGVFGFKFWVYR